MSEWEPIETAPKDGTIIDLWIKGKISDIEFYCADKPIYINDGWYGGRSTNWWWFRDKFRPYMGLNKQAPVFIEPLYWMPVPDPPTKKAPS